MKANEIFLARRAVGIDQRELAMALGMQPQRLSDIERGYTPAPKGFQRKVRTALKSILEKRLSAVGRR